MRFESATDKSTTQDEENLSDYLLILKILLENIRNSLRIIQREVEIDLSNYIDVLSQCVLLNPVKKTQRTIRDNKLGTNF